MFDKSFLVNKVVNSLLSRDFHVLVSEGAFDVAAKKKQLMLVKTQMNVDALQQEHAMSLRSISYFLSANPFFVSVKSNREFLQDNLVYSRFQLPVVTPEMFENVLEGDVPAISSAKGKHATEIDTAALREKREHAGFSLQELSDLIGISKKALYEIEKRRKNPSAETVEKLEKALNIQLAKNYEMKKVMKPTYLRPKNDFQKTVSKHFNRIGIDNSAVHAAPFEIVGKESFSLTTNLASDTSAIKDVKQMKKLSSVLSAKALFVAKKSREENIGGVPVLVESELQDIVTSKELTKRIKEKA